MTKYENVRKSMIESITSGQYKSGDKLPTESVLMKQYGVSRYTIRRAMGELENEHYIYKIQGGGMYVDDWQANRHRQVTNKMIGIVTTHLADYIFPSIISGIDRAISGQGYSVLLSNTHNDHDQERQSLQRMLESNVDGLILEPTQSALPNPNKDLYQQITQSNIPALFINAHYDELGLPYIQLNDRHIEYQLTSLLFNKGHKNILGIFQIDDFQGVERMRGFMDAYAQHPEYSYLSDVVMYQSTDDMAKIFKKTARHLEAEERPTAIVCYNDQLAIQIMNVVRSLGLKIPDDVSIVGFDDYLLSKYVTPGLTTAVHPKNRMGVDAGRMILSMIEGKKVEPIVYDAEIIERNSVANLNNK
ncbi:GntR family transcriptional regulator [Limosilactobacillus sp.]|uniref:GntR family transcriptional regulator n=1 Tax=Limosilactobacillus sp. TaxID=2773925 RepID=UPI0025C3300D|nr:GntR family transcriptional regulator [Limosilactobacillus sp.]MCH3922333.1 GntR family transcriptional regulator [Limosilactobacillus sp.]MCH3929105.1 GntR family transcriptional regulator [Limosilactobacillus sp.]